MPKNCLIYNFFKNLEKISNISKKLNFGYCPLRMVSGRGTLNNQGLGMTTEYWPKYWCRVFVSTFRRVEFFVPTFLACRVFRIDFSACRVFSVDFSPCTTNSRTKII